MVLEVIRSQMSHSCAERSREQRAVRCSRIPRHQDDGVEPWAFAMLCHAFYAFPCFAMPEYSSSSGFICEPILYYFVYTDFTTLLIIMDYLEHRIQFGCQTKNRFSAKQNKKKFRFSCLRTIKVFRKYDGMSNLDLEQ